MFTCGSLEIITTFHNPKKRGKRTFGLTVQHATWREMQQTIEVICTDPLDTYEIDITSHECDVH